MSNKNNCGWEIWYMVIRSDLGSCKRNRKREIEKKNNPVFYYYVSVE